MRLRQWKNRGFVALGFLLAIIFIILFRGGELSGTVFVSISNGKLGAEIFQGWENVPKNVKDEGKWFKIDTVTDVNEVKNFNFVESMDLELGLDGIAFGKDFDVVLLPEEVVVGEMIDDEGKLILTKVSSYLKRRGETVPVASLKGTDGFYIFQTKSVFYEKGGEEALLYRGHKMYMNIDSEFLMEVVGESANYLQDFVDLDGKFVYEYFANSGEVSEDYNYLRHAGTTYAMLEVYEKTGDSELLAQAKLALDYLAKRVENCNFNGENGAKCLLEKGNVKLGGNALYILAISKYTEVTGDAKYLSVAHGLAQWMVNTRDAEGHLYIHKQDNESGKVDDFISEYYPGEAIFALVRLYEVDGRVEWLDAAEGEANYLINVRDKGVEAEDLTADHWLLYGLNELYRYRDNEIFLEHSFKIAEGILGQQWNEKNVEFVDWAGGYYAPPRSTPTATRTEGLIAAYKLARDFGYEDEAAQILSGIERGIAFELQTLIEPATAMYLADPETALGGFRSSLTDFEVRIDYVQHNISAMLGYAEILSTGTGLP